MNRKERRARGKKPQNEWVKYDIMATQAVQDFFADQAVLRQAARTAMDVLVTDLSQHPHSPLPYSIIDGRRAIVAKTSLRDGDGSAVELLLELVPEMQKVFIYLPHEFETRPLDDTPTLN
jgi:hypothetical protein